ncbi:MAG: hypothetical protein AseanaTS_14710 [Candidatus Pelagadaptatus aseana]|uniref:hypothetical protein n=1 Tax=Candidatus Pelagadaptatus aseana TaxID=3120508 RepID=UPI0039B1C3B8
MKRISKHITGLLLASGMAGAFASAPVSTLREALVEAMTESPDVMASWYDLRASVEEQRVAQGGVLPKS